MKRSMWGKNDWSKFFNKHPEVVEQWKQKKQDNTLTTKDTMPLNQSEPKTYLNVNGGKVTVRCTENTPGAIKRQTSQGDTVYELQYTDVTGYLVNIGTREGKYGKEWVLAIDDGIEIFQMSLPYSSGNANGLLFALPNINFSKPIKFVPWYKEVMGDDNKMKKKSCLYLHQDDQTVPWYYSKDEPNGLPPLVKVVFKGQEQWDDTERMIFLDKMVRDEAMINIKNANLMRDRDNLLGKYPNTPQESIPGKIAPNQAIVEEPATDFPHDDLPF